jgi:tRNA pseudouridine(55) synthase
MKGINLVHKARGETLSEMLKRFKKEHPGMGDVALTYAGRLDPMAEGLVILLAGEAVHEKDVFLKLDKTYTVEILFGFKTDTLDVLGELVEVPNRVQIKPITLQEALSAVEGILGVHTDPYPVYSSKTVGGSPLFALARAGKLEDVEIPEHTYAVIEAKVIGLKQIPLEALLSEIKESVSRVKGDFRQDRIIELWDEHTRSLYDVSFDVLTVQIRSTSGAYMRGIAEKIGKALGFPALALTIRRDQIGEYQLNAAH